MSLTITAIPDFIDIWGKFRVQGVQLQPAAADYVTGGYPITASAAQLGKLQGAWITLTNRVGASYLAQFVGLAGSFSPVGTPQTTVYLKVVYANAVAGLAPFTEVAAGTDLSGVTWEACFLGW